LEDSLSSRSAVGRASRSVVAEIDDRLKTLDAQLASHEELLAERQRLRAARATLLGESPAGQITKDDVAAYLKEHPGSRPAEIADALGVSSNRVSAHLFRSKTTRFIKRGDGWHLREPKATASRSQGGGS
jgi:DNA-directed RNA polymerase specialized sigma24 family protein